MKIQIGLWAFVFLMTGALWAQSGDPGAGKTLVMQGNSRGAAACMACHGQNGAGQEASGFPQLAGLNSQYLAQQLRDYQSQKRINPVMLPIAKALSEKEILDAAAYFSSLPPVAIGGKPPKPEVLKRGQEIAQNGVWEKGVPACYSCHGPQGVGVGSQFPRISFQHKAYIIQQIDAWKSNQRKNDPNNLMKTVSKKLSKADIEAVASFLSAQAPVVSKGEKSK